LVLKENPNILKLAAVELNQVVFIAS